MMWIVAPRCSGMEQLAMDRYMPGYPKFYNWYPKFCNHIILFVDSKSLGLFHLIGCSNFSRIKSNLQVNATVGGDNGLFVTLLPKVL